MITLAANLSASPPGAWRGDALMLAQRHAWRSTRSGRAPLIRRSGPIAFAVSGMVIGTACLATLSWATGGIEAVAGFGPPQWGAAVYFAVVCGPGSTSCGASGRDGFADHRRPDRDGKSDHGSDLRGFAPGRADPAVPRCRPAPGGYGDLRRRWIARPAARAALKGYGPFSTPVRGGPPDRVRALVRQP